MPIENDKLRYLQAISCLSGRLQKTLSAFSDKIAPRVQEIRLRLNRPLVINCLGVTYYVSDKGSLCTDFSENTALKVTKSDITESFGKICNYSVYNRQTEIINGYITMKGGHRAGICGTAVLNENKISNIRDITTINIRVSREYHGCADALNQKLGSLTGGVLICGAPCSGKTTVLRDYANILSTSRALRVSLIDERGELAGAVSGFFQNDVGLCDVYDGYGKADAMLQAIRSMAPDVIVCDEIGSEQDVFAIEKAINSGVMIVATVHAANKTELMHKHNIMKLISLYAFSKIVFLSNRNHPGEIVKIMNSGDIIGH